MAPSRGPPEPQGLLQPWQAERKNKLISEHKLYGVPLECERLLGRARPRAAASWSLPVRWAVAYLIMGEDDISDKEAAMWSNTSDVFVLTYKTWRDDAIFCPDLVIKPGDKSAFSKGRNTLMLAAQMWELRRGWAYQHYVFVDADIEPQGTWERSLPGFEGFLRDWEPAVGVPLYYNEQSVYLYTHMFNLEQYVDPSKPRSIAWHDQQFIALHHEAAQVIMPLDSRLDLVDAMISQWAMISLASLLFRGHILLYMGMEIRNPKHERDPDKAVQVQMENVSHQLRSRVPPHLRPCVLDPWNTFAIAFSDSGFRARHIRGVLRRDFRLKQPPPSTVMGEHGFVFLHSYYPWGSALRKDRSYAAATLPSSTGCDDEPEFRAYWWRRTCHGPKTRSVDSWLACARFNFLGADQR